MTSRRPWMIGPALIAALLVALVAILPASAAAPRPVGQLGPRGALDPCARPVPFGRGGGPGEEILQLSPEDSSALLLQIFGHRQPVRRAVFGATGDLILTISGGGSVDLPSVSDFALFGDGVGIWDAFSGDQQYFLDDVRDGAVSPDGAYLAAIYAEDDRLLLSVFDENGELYRELLPEGSVIEQMEFTPDGDQLVLVDNSWYRDSGWGNLIVWDIAEAKIAHRIGGTVVEIPLTDARAERWIDYSLDGETVALVEGGHADYINSIAFSPDGRLVASAGWDGTVRIWSLKTGRATGCIEVTPDPGQVIALVKFSPDGREVASVYPADDSDTGNSILRYDLWRVKDGRRQEETVLQALPGQYLGGVLSGDLSPDLSRIVLPEGKAVQLWDTASGELTGLVRQPGYANSARFSPDGTTFVAAYNFRNDIDESVYFGALLWDATHLDLDAGAEMEVLVAQATQLLMEGKQAQAQRFLRRANAVNPFPWYEPKADAEARAGLAEPADGSIAGVVRAGGKLNMRALPRQSARLVAQIPDGAEVKAYARSADGRWLFVATLIEDIEWNATDYMALAWVARQYVNLAGDLEDLQIKR